MMNTNRPDLPDELRAMAGQIESAAELGHVATFLHAAVEEFEAVGFTHEEAFSLALQGERFLAEQSREEQGREERAVGPQLFKSVRPDGTDFCTGKVRWLPAEGVIPEGGWLVEHPHPGEVGSWDATGYLSASTAETDRTGFQRPSRLLSVEPVGTMWTPYPDSFPRVRAAHTWRVVEELPAWWLFGPQGREIAAIIEQASHLTSAQIEGLTAAWRAAQVASRCAAWDAARHASRHAARGTALDAARDAARRAALGSVRDAVRDAAPSTAPGATCDAAYRSTQDAALGAAYGTLNAVLGWLVKDLISDEDFRTLTGPWTQVMGQIEVTV